MMKNEKILSRTGWGRVGMHLSLAGLVVLGLLLALSAPWPSPVSAATTRYVAPGGSCGGANPCYAKIQDAINAASSGDTIKVAQGTYNENLVVNKAVSLLGGFSTSDWSTRGPASSTTINGSGSSDSVIRVSANATIDNFTITGGQGYYSPAEGGYTMGGGIHIQSCAPIISNNVIQGNSANWGGGLYISGEVGQPQILYNTISGNTAVRTTKWGWGGGFYVTDASPYIKGNTISGNHAYWGGGFLLWHSASVIEGNTITGNSALGSDYDSVGGALFVEESAPTIRNNIIVNNIAQRRADGIYLKRFDPTHPGAQAQIVNNTIVANKYSDNTRHAGISIKGEGGDTIAPIIRNNIFALNGCGIQVFGDGTPVYPVLSNNDVWGNTAANYDGLSPGPGDISADPLLSGDYHLQAGSPCINAGTSTDAPDTDFEGDPRPLEGGYDIGADEYASWIVKQARPTSPDPGDVITYTITYRNNTTSTVSCVITDILSTTLLSPSFTSDRTITRTGIMTYVWDVGNLDQGEGGTITITAQVDPNVVTPTAMWNTAEFYAAGVGSFSDEALMIVGGLETYLPLILKNY